MQRFDEPDGDFDHFDDDDDFGGYEDGPRDNEVPVSVAFDAVLGETPDIALFVSGLRVFSNCVEFQVHLRSRVDGPGMRSWLGRPPSDEDDGDRFLMGVETADGGWCTNLEWGWGPRPRSGPVLQEHGGSGGGHSAEATFSLAPLPPPGGLTLVCAWPGQGVPETTTALPCEAILEAARRVRVLWTVQREAPRRYRPVPPVVPPGGWFARRLGESGGQEGREPLLGR